MRSHRTPRIVCTALLVALCTAVAPSSALASRLASDKIDDITLSSGRISRSYAPDVSGRAGTLMVQGGRRLWTRGASTQRAMASTTKIMTAIVVLENCSLTENVTVTKTAARTPYALGLRTGEKRSVRKMLELLLVCSSNDAATALAIHTAGSVPRFASMMNAKAAQLGMTRTHYVNAHGLDAKGHHSSAADINRLMRNAIRYPEFSRVIAMRSVYLPKYGSRRARTVASTNKLFGKVTGLRGGKTGFTNDAGYCFAASATRNGITLTAVVLKAGSSASRFASTKTLLDWGFKNYQWRSYGSTATVGSVPVSNVESASVPVRFARPVVVPVFAPRGKVTRLTQLPPSVDAPVAEGQEIGVVSFVQDGSVIATGSLVAATSVEGPSIIEQAEQVLQAVF